MKKLLFIFTIAFSCLSMAQNNIEIESGAFDFLKNQTEVNVELKFDNVLFQADNFTEEQYLERRKTEVLKNKNELKWKKWSSEWQNFKDNEYTNFVLKGLNKTVKKIDFKQNSNAKYTLIIDTKWIFAGWHAGLIWQEAKLTSDLIFVETDNPSNVIMKIKGNEILGNKPNKHIVMEYGRIAAAYEKTGKLLGIGIIKSLRKK